MSNEIKTYLIEDHRVSGITDEILVGVKKSVSTSTMNKYVLESKKYLFMVDVDTDFLTPTRISSVIPDTR